MKRSKQQLVRSGAAQLAIVVALATSVASAEDVAERDFTDENIIVVTGSHIARAVDEKTSPVSIISSEQIALTGKGNITDILVRTPALSASLGLAQASGAHASLGNVGVNVLNLRNLGAQRTLVLVDGKRHVAGVTNTAAVDMNEIPLELIERVEVLTGGASAAYGADGVSGVVNVILKRNIEGLHAKAQSGLSSRGDAASYIMALTAGTSFADKRGAVTLGYEWNKNERVHSSRRKVTGDAATYSRLVRNVADLQNGDDPAVLDYFRQNNLTWHMSSPSGVIALPTGLFLGDGRPYEMGIPLGDNDFAIGGSNTAVAGYYGDLTPDVDRHTLNVLTSFEFSPALRAYVDAKYVRSTTYSLGQPSYLTNLLLSPFNPYLWERFGPDAAAEGAMIMGRDAFDFGLRGERNKRESARVVLGVDGRLTDHLRYDLSFNYGRTDVKNRQLSSIIEDRLYAALNAVADPMTGAITCLSTVAPGMPIDWLNPTRPITSFQDGAGSACRPLNLLGDGAPDQAALNFILADAVNHSRISQTQISGVISGDTAGFYALPAGPIAFAIGGEYRKEKSAFSPNSYLANGQILDQNPILASGGQFDVGEVFAEINLPILAGQPLVEQLSVGAAVRYSDYSTVGRSTSWKLDALYAPVADIRFRATYSKAVRAPNIAEIFQPQTPTFGQLVDPCHIALRGQGSSNRANNCVTLLRGLGLTDTEIATFTPPLDSLYQGEFRGNAALQEERAKTWTAGFTLQPQFLSGLTVSVDWYQIKVSDVINTASAQELAALCVDQASLDNVYCANLFRDPDSGNFYGQRGAMQRQIGFISTPLNMSALKTAGADFAVSYRFMPSPKVGQFQFDVQGGYLDRIDLYSVAGAAADHDLLEQNNPRWRGSANLNWSLQNVSLNYGVNYWSKTRRFTNEEVAAHADLAAAENLWFRAKIEHDIRASASVRDQFQIYGGVNNVFDRQPDFGETAYPINGIGRYFYMGVKAQIF